VVDAAEHWRESDANAGLLWERPSLICRIHCFLALFGRGSPAHIVIGLWSAFDLAAPILHAETGKFDWTTAIYQMIRNKKG
jgi:hypothetical protein